MLGKKWSQIVARFIRLIGMWENECGDEDF